MFFKVRSVFLSAYYRFRMKYTAFAKFSKNIGKSGVETPEFPITVGPLANVRRSVLSVCERTPWES